ncbi:RecA-family ATPase-like protein [Pseudogulbenkiania sp. NH8B]|uniref:AAA family ATPase n=1 Tax=Pseudogulbenkiania sp. (strain NH8B) TaxID=748280 RepID=UPI0002279EE0|nr:AAA family ATPase [Pseudogulbenkiania sp. NH8B]BAK76671.1 RecA-family ATPase-like protein [Pseudogulbenkiania sp. NH8B]
MSLENEKGRPAPDGQEGKFTLVQNNDSPSLADLQALCSPFAPYAGLKCWVPWTLIQKSGKAKAGKVPHNGQHGLSTNDPSDWCTLPEALATASEWGLSGVGIVLTGGITVDNQRLVGLDFDDVGEAFELPFSTYSERSPSGKGVRAFVTVPAEWAASRQDNGRGHYPNCDHCEVYLGSGGRFLTVTGDAIESRPFAELKGSDLSRLDALLKKAEKIPAAVSMPSSDQAGAVIDLNAYPLTNEHRALIEGKIPQGQRSEVFASLILMLAENGASKADVYATCMQTPGLLEYLSKHPGKEEQFAQDEIDRLFGKAVTPRLGEICEAFKNHFPPTAAENTSTIPDDYFEDIGAEEAKPVGWLIRSYFEANAVMLMFGPYGCFKTFIALDVAVSVATGLPWHGHAVSRSGTVIYLCGEGKNNIRRRVSGLCRERNLDMKTLKIKLVRITQDLTDEQCTARLKAAIGTLSEPPALIIVDTLARHFGSGNENATEDMNRFINHIDHVRGEASVLIVHHSGHEKPDRPRGASSLPSGMDAIYQIKREEKGQCTRLHAAKMKDAQYPPDLFLQTKIVNLPFEEEDGTPATTVVLEDSEDQRAVRQEVLYQRYPDLKSRKSYLPQLLEKIHDNPGTGQVKLAALVGKSPDTINTVVKLLKGYGLMDARWLTQAGIDAAAALLPHRADIIFTALKGASQGIRFMQNETE